MSTRDAQIQRDQEWAGDLDESVREMVLGLLKDLHTSAPGIIKSYDPATQTATVQAAIKRVFVDDGPVALPLCVDVPVYSAGGGDFVHTFPVATGDECLMVFAERCIDNWWDRGGVQEPFEVRFHDLSDAFAIVGIRSRPKFLKNVATDASELRTVDGETMFRLEKGTAFVGGKIGAVKMLAGETFLDALNTYLGALETYATALGGLPGMTGPAGVFATAAAAFHAAQATYLATKAKVL